MLKSAEVIESKVGPDSPLDLQRFQRTNHWYSFWIAGKEKYYMEESAS